MTILNTIPGHIDAEELMALAWALPLKREHVIRVSRFLGRVCAALSPSHLTLQFPPPSASSSSPHLLFFSSRLCTLVPSFFLPFVPPAPSTSGPTRSWRLRAARASTCRFVSACGGLRLIVECECGGVFLLLRVLVKCVLGNQKKILQFFCAPLHHDPRRQSAFFQSRQTGTKLTPQPPNAPPHTPHTTTPTPHITAPKSCSKIFFLSQNLNIPHIPNIPPPTSIDAPPLAHQLLEHLRHLDAAQALRV